MCGEGTFVRGLETTATYDALTKTFVLSSPSGGLVYVGITCDTHTHTHTHTHTYTHTNTRM